MRRTTGRASRRRHLGPALAVLLAATLVPPLFAASAARSGAVAASDRLYVAPNGSDAGSCTKAAPCKSFDRAYKVAQPGQVVEVAGGSYPEQRLWFDPSKASASQNVVFTPASGATPIFPRSNSLNFGGTSGPGAQHVELRGFKMDDVGVQCAVGVTLRDLDMGLLNILSSQTVNVVGGDVGPWVEGVTNIKQFGDPGCGSYGNPINRNIVIDGVRFHDFTIANFATHSECLQFDLGATDGAIIRNSTFQNCTDFDILVNGRLTNAVIENNFFDDPMDPSAQGGPTQPCSPSCARGGYAIKLNESGGITSNVTVQYNTMLGAFTSSPNNQNIVVRGNIGNNANCPRPATYSHNLWASTACSADDRRLHGPLADLFVDGDPSDGTMDLHLRRGAEAIDRGDPASVPARDIDGQARPGRWAPDAGADQREPVTITLGRSIGAVAIGSREADVVAFYGEPRRVTTAKAGPEKRRVRVAVYRVHGGRLDVTYDEGRVVGVRTTSPYYSTVGGLGVKTDLTHSRLAPFHWEQCLGAYRRYVGAVAVYVRPAAGRKNAPSGSVTMLRRAYEKC